MATTGRLVRASAAFRGRGGLARRLQRLTAQAAYVTGAEGAFLILGPAAGARPPLPVGAPMVAARMGMDDAAHAAIDQWLAQEFDGAVTEGDVDRARDALAGEGLSALAERAAELAGLPYHRAFPLAFCEGDWGLLILASGRDATLAERDVSLVLPIVEAVETALEVAVQSVASVEAREQEVKALLEIGKEISALGSLDRVLELICRKTAELLGVEISYVALRDKREPIIRMRMTYGISPAWRYRMWMRFGQGVGGTVAATARPLLIEEYESFEHPTRSDIRSMVMEEGIKAVVAVPMFIGSQVTGVLYGADRRPAHFSERDVRLLEGLADQAAIAIANSELYESERREVEVHDRLTAVVLRDGDFWSIAGELHALVGNPVALYDGGLRLLACHPAGEEDVHHLGVLDELIREDPALAEDLVLRPRADRQATILPGAPDRGLPVARAIAPAVSGDEAVGFVHILEVERPLEPQDVRIAERAGVILALRRTRERVEAEIAQRMRGEVLDDLLSENLDIVESAVRRSPHLGHDPTGPHLVVVADLRRPSGANGAGAGNSGGLIHLQRLFTSVRRALDAAGLDAICDTKEERTVAVVRRPAQSDGGGFVEQVRVGLIEGLRLQAASTSVVVGVGTEAGEPAELRRSYEEALTSLKAGLERERGPAVMCYDQLGLVGLLFEPSDPGRLSRFVQDRIGALLTYDRDHKSELVRTVEVYLDHSCSKVETARRLNVHLNTLKYRLERVENILGCDLSDADRRFELHLALRALAVERMMGASG